MSIGAALCCASGALAQLQAHETLVVYDSRITDSRDVAEYYAGSARVPGGTGNLAGVHPGVRVLNLASTGAAASAPGNISYTDFVSLLRNPIRSAIGAQGLAREVRCLVLTKGLPHRIYDINNPTVADFPNQTYVDTLEARNLSAASVDSELTLIWQDLSVGEANGNADSKADGLIVNPYWKSGAFLNTFTTANIQTAKTFTATGMYGPLWSLAGSGATRLTAGDMLLVARLDGRTIADIRASIDRAQNILVNMQTTTAVLDESGSDGIANLGANAEFDNDNSAFAALRASDDYETARNLLQTDGRFSAANIRYNALAGSNNFFVGSRLAFLPGQGILLPDNRPLILLATYGANHEPANVGTPFLADGSPGFSVYGNSYFFAPGSVYNSIESFNGRDFGGLGQLSFAPQMQAADILAAGGTFALCNCWEPLADTVPDNAYVVQNFLLGNMTWGEAAWTSIPALSWMQIVIGDPLARVRRSSEDVSGDGRVSIEDLYSWEQSPVDINRDASTNAADRAILVRTLRAWERMELTDGRR